MDLRVVLELLEALRENEGAQMLVDVTVIE